MKSSRLISLLLTLSIIFTLIFSIAIPAGAATLGGSNNATTTPTGYTSADDVKYVTSGSYVYNWGARGEVATFLSKYAVAYYAQKSNYAYSYLSTLSGGTTQSSAGESSLYYALQDMMEAEHTNTTSYSETKNQFKYTDCVSSNTSKISSFYSGSLMGSSWGSGWNREHTWPNSKGLGGSDEDDIMMLRPTLESENSSRGNTAYGEGSSYFDPGKTQRGDVARIMLYQYTRWGNKSKMWGTSGVMENMTVLLKWMEEDPVDTWEMGRNDAVEKITGVRNVFVDYPEYAFLLFGKDVPENYSTPSKSGGSAVNPGTGNGGSGSTGGTTPEEPAFEPVKPVAGTAYKLALLHETNNAIYYIDGTMAQTYYFGTTENFASGVDVYVENASGGYYIYATVNGAKQYINLVAATGSDGKEHVNIHYQSGASTVYTYDEAKETMVTTVATESGNKQYAIGTRSDKTYTTISPVDTSKGSFYSHFVLTEGTVGGGSTGGETPEPHVHSYGAWTVVTPATETTYGEEKRTCSCGAFETRTIDKLQSGGSTGGTNPPASDGIQVNTPYYITSTVAKGTTYFSGTVTDGRIDGVIGSTGATEVKLEAANGGYYITFTVGGAKKYLGFNSSASSKTKAFEIYDSASENAIWVIDENAKTVISKVKSDRGIATQVASEYTTFCTYSTQNLNSSEYSWSWFVPVNGNGGSTGGETPEPHVHSYGAWTVVTPATETTYGEEKRTCSCGAFETRTIDKLQSGGNGGGTVTPPSTDFDKIVNDAWNLPIGGTLGTQTLTGVVSEITDPYSEQYKNVTFVIIVNGLTDKPIVCFRVKGADGTDTAAVKVGDTVTLTGELLNYEGKDGSGTVEFNSNARFVIEASQGGETPAPHVHSYGAWTVVTPATETTDGLEKRTCSCGHYETKVIPATGSGTETPPDEPKLDTPEDIVNAAWALAPGATLGTQTLTGVVSEITGPYSEQYKNVTFVIIVNGLTDKPIVCFRVKGADGNDTAAVKVGDIVTVTGELLNYVSKDGSGTVEFNSGSTFVYSEEEAPHEHSFGDWSLVKEPTEEEEGLEERKCACGETETRRIDKLPSEGTDNGDGNGGTAEEPKKDGCKGEIGSTAIIVIILGSISVLCAAVVCKKKQD